MSDPFQNCFRQFKYQSKPVIGKNKHLLIDLIWNALCPPEDYVTAIAAVFMAAGLGDLLDHFQKLFVVNSRLDTKLCKNRVHL